MAIPTLIQQTSRTVHTTRSGIDIVREFYVEPYDAHPEVIKELQGWVEDLGEGAKPRWKRHPPSHDPYIANCYCTDTRVDFAHEDAMASSPGIFKGGDIQGSLQDTKEKPAAGMAGAKITAHYRPLITAWPGSDAGGTTKWDWLDPIVTPGFRQIPWPEGLFVRAPQAPGGALAGAGLLGGLIAVAAQEQTINVPDEVGSPISVPIKDITIRRILVGEPPWKVIDACANAVNQFPWPALNHGTAGNLPQFPAATLKFMGAETPHMIDTEGNRYYEVTYHFQQISLWADQIFDQNANEQATWVTWNHIFMRPGRWGIKRPTAWYEVFRGDRLELKQGLKLPVDIPGFAANAGRLHHEVKFDDLFKLNP